MARILFAVNEHPSEAFAISVARETAKLLRKAGHKVIWKKIKAKETMLGAVIKSKRGKRFAEGQLARIDKQSRLKLVDAVNKVKPHIAYNFHCTPSDSNLWKSRFGRHQQDFDISPSSVFHKDLQLVEIKAHYQRLPERLLKRIDKRTPSKPPGAEKYLTRTTSQELTRGAGLTPEAYADAIAARIKKQIKFGAFHARGIIIKGGKPKAKAKPRKPKQRRFAR